MLYPLIHLKHVMSMLSLKLPLCELNTEKAKIEVGGREGRRKGSRRTEGERKRGREGGEGREEREVCCVDSQDQYLQMELLRMSRY